MSGYRTLSLQQFAQDFSAGSNNDAEAAREAKAATEAEAARRRAAEETEVEHIEKIKDDARDAKPPSAEELGIDVEGLTPGREALARYQAWLARERAELAELEERHNEYLRQMAIPLLTQKERDDLIAADKSGFMAWARNGSKPDEEPEVHTFQVEDLRNKLAHDKHKAEVAAATLEGLHKEIEDKKLRLEIVEKKRGKYEAGALESEQEPLKAELHTLAARMKVVLLQSKGLEVAISAAGSTENNTQPLTHLLPAIGPSGHYVDDSKDPNRIHITRAEIEAAAKPWRVLRGKIADDPWS